MKSFEKEIKRRILLIALAAILGGLAIIITFVVHLNLSGIATETDSGLSMEILVGFFIGLELTATYRIIRYWKALTNNDSLEELEIKETDERNRIIALRACRLCIHTTFLFLGIAGIISAIFNRIVFLTISSTLIIILLLYIALMFYYSRKL